jgi:hypothetical protein
MTIFPGIIPITSSHLLFLWLLPHKKINMTCYYVSVCIQKIKSFDNYNMHLAFTTPSGNLFLLMHLKNTILHIIKIQFGEILTIISLWLLCNVISKEKYLPA